MVMDKGLAFPPNKGIVEAGDAAMPEAPPSILSPGDILELPADEKARLAA